MPGKRADLVAMARTWHEVITKKNAVWKIPVNDVDLLHDSIQSVEEAEAKIAADGPTPYNKGKVTVAYDELKSHMRKIKARCFFAPPLSNPDYLALGLKLPDHTKTPVAVPTGQAEADVTYPGPHLLMLHMKALSGTMLDSRADHGYRIYYGLMPPGGATAEEASGEHRYLMKAAVHGEDLPHSDFTRRKKKLFEFNSADSGKTAYFAIRYENGKGPWGPVFSAVIP
jgi:hypothetical protein